MLLLLFISIPLLMRSKTNPVTSLLDVVLQRKPQDVIPPTTHIVLFQFKQSVTPFQVKEVSTEDAWKINVLILFLDHVENAGVEEVVHPS